MMPRKLRLKTRLRHWLASTRPEQPSHGWLGRLKQSLTDPRLWHFNRYNVAKGVALGLFIAFIPLPIQIILAMLGAWLFRVNLPATIAVTWITNPFTFIPILYVSYLIGSWFVPHAGTLQLPHYATELGTWAWLTESWHWLITLGKPILIGAPILAISAALIGYALVMGLWRLVTWLEYRKRKHQRHQRGQ